MQLRPSWQTGDGIKPYQPPILQPHAFQHSWLIERDVYLPSNNPPARTEHKCHKIQHCEL